MMEEDNEGTATYEPLSKRKVSVAPEEDSPSTSPPKDTRNFVYLSLLSAGIGFVLPYNSFIVAADYWQERFKGRSVALDMSMTYILVAFVTVLLNNLLLAMASFRVRVSFGYIISFTTLIFVAICEVGFHVFSKTTAYSVCLAAVSLVSLGCTVQQSSFYGFASMFPKQYTQAVMAGESIAGLLVSSNRVLTKILISNERISTVIFFFTSTIYIGFSYVLHSIAIGTPFVRYYHNSTKKCSKIILVPDEDHSLTESVRRTQNYSISLDSDTPPTLAPLSFSNPVYDLSNQAETATSSTISPSNTNGVQDDVPNVAFKVEHEIRPGERYGSFCYGLSCRYRVASSIYSYMASIAIAYCVTLSLYPGIEAEIISCSLGTWMPVLLMFTFNAADVLGKVLAAVPYQWSRRQLVLMSTLRVLIVPLLLLCCAPRERPVIAGETAAFIFTAAFGLTNGLAGSLPMILAPLKVPGQLKEIAGKFTLLILIHNILLRDKRQMHF